MAWLDAFVIPDHVAGFLEWVSGILFVNRTLEEWNKVNNSSEHDQYDRDITIINQTITHETYHFYQISITGYLYHFTSKLFNEISRLLPLPLNQESLRSTIENPPKLSSEADNLLNDMDRDGPNNLTVRDIVESSAYLYEFKSHYPRFGIQAFKEQMKIDKISKEYHYAFDIGESYLGKTSYDNFLVVAMLALCFEDPPEAFFTIIELVRKGGIVYKQPDDLISFISLSERISKYHKGLGSAAQVAFQNSNSEFKHNPLFYEVVHTINLNASRIPPLALLVDPEVMQNFAQDVVIPMLLKDGVVWIPNEYRNRMKDPNLELRIRTNADLGIISLRILNATPISRFWHPMIP